VLAATLALYALVQILYITATPLQTITLPDNLPRGGAQSLLVGIGPDEKEHFLYVLSLAERGALPTPTPARRTDPGQYVSYQAQHPPLFYALAALVYKAAAGLGPAPVWYLLRVLCALCGVAVIVLAARAARAAFPDRPVVAAAAAPFVAFLPMFGHMTGNLSNEPLAMALGAWAWLRTVRIARAASPPTNRDAAVLGTILGLAALTRLTALLWLPAAVIVLAHAAARRAEATGTRSERRFAPLLVFAACFGALVGMWFLRNQVAFGTPVLRTFDRPLLAGGATLAQFLGPGIEPPGFPVPVNALFSALWYASTSWLPFWLVQFYLPGGLAAAPLWQRLFLALDVLVLLALFVHASRAKKAPAAAADPAGRTLLWAAAASVGFCVAVLVQQELWADWNVVLSAGRYTVAAVPASALLFLFAVSTTVARATPRRQRIVALVIAAGMLAFDVYAAVLVRRFYAGNPAQPSVQPIAARARNDAGGQYRGTHRGNTAGLRGGTSG
jgi:hypothetical protein